MAKQATKMKSCAAAWRNGRRLGSKYRTHMKVCLRKGSGVGKRHRARRRR